MKKLIILTAMILMSLSAFAQSDKKNDDEIYVYGQIMRRHSPDCLTADNVELKFSDDIEDCISDDIAIAIKINKRTPMINVLNKLAAKHWQLVCCYTDDCGLTVWMIQKKLKYFSPEEQKRIKLRLLQK